MHATTELYSPQTRKAFSNSGMDIIFRHDAISVHLVDRSIV